ncbi:MAG: deoxyribose-phosphate aldolase [Clostridiales bacterium]|nr:deoxyribose-phosphate aldolase [Clostridiales bacterium]
MDIRNILNATDHTLLRPTATWAEIEVLIDEAADFGCASVCIPPSFVYEAVEYADGKIPVCTVVGFPNGYSTTGAKLFETEDALESGAEEIDMVINLGWVKDGLWDFIEDEIMQIRDLCEDAILKVIVETSELTDQEKIHLCQIVTSAEADFIKTSTGFSSCGATEADIRLFRAHAGPKVGIKASGGIRTLEDAEKMMALGATRLGASSIVKLARPLLDEE